MLFFTHTHTHIRTYAHHCELLFESLSKLKHKKKFFVTFNAKTTLSQIVYRRRVHCCCCWCFVNFFMIIAQLKAKDVNGGGGGSSVCGKGGGVLQFYLYMRIIYNFIQKYKFSFKFFYQFLQHFVHINISLLWIVVFYFV